MALDFSSKVEDAVKDITMPEQLLGAGLMIPFCNTNSSSRLIMASTHRTHALQLLNPEKAIIQTGYEIRYGDYSSSISKADRTYEVIAKVSKFSSAPNHHYWLILRDVNSNYLDIQERISYEPETESYGFLYNNEYMDNLNVRDIIPKDTIVQKSLAFDKYNNRAEGRNFNTIYLSLDDNMEDSVIMSDKAAGMLTSPLVKPVEIMINDNDIPLNLYGDDHTYKSFPDIGEDVKNSNLIALRKERKDEAYYTQSVDRLRQIIMSDEIKQVNGKVVDIDIYCNNPDILDTYYYGQFRFYYNDLVRMSTEVYQLILPYVSQGYKLSYDLEKFYANAKRVCNRDQYMDKRTFSNILLKITVLEELKMNPGDKVANRYGGKGVVSDIWPQEFMPRYKNARGEYVYADIIFNSLTMYGRENPGQVFELSLTHIGTAIIDKIIGDNVSLDEACDLYYKYLSLIVPEEAKYFLELKANMSREDLAFYMESVIKDDHIDISAKPISDSITIDKLNEIYKAFPFIKKNEIEVTILGSDGFPRHIKARRSAIMGKEYILRLKQYAEEKFSATSLSSTNIKNENTKSRNKKEFKGLYPNTPIRFGNMESTNFQHIGVENVISNLMIHSTSPQGRRLVEQMYTGDPFSIDIKLDSDSKNRSAEICSTYLKTIGRRLKFTKVKKYLGKVVCPISFREPPIRKPIRFISEELREGYDYVGEFNKRQERYEKGTSPLRFSGGKKWADRK